MIETEQLIHEVKKRENIWNAKRYIDNSAKRKSWEEIALALNHNYEDFTPAEKDETVESLKSKWRNIRDYYIKEKRKNSKKSGGQKKRYNKYELLAFLDPVIKQKRSTALQRVKENLSDEEEEMVTEYLEVHSDDMPCEQYHCADSYESFSNNSRTIKQEKEEAMAVSKTESSFEFQIPPADVSQEEDKVKANKNFLLSLLPDVSSLNERQNMRFRLGVLNLLNEIKFETK